MTVVPPVVARPGGRKRPRAGCAVGVAVLAGVLIGGFLFFDRGVDWTARRARARLEAALPADLPGSERARLATDLDRFFASLGNHRGARRRLGELLGRVARILEDGRVTPAEVEELEDFLEGRPEKGGADHSTDG